MKTSECIEFFGSKAKLAGALGIEPPSVYSWKDYPPPIRQLQLERLTEGKLKAERSVLSIPSRAPDMPALSPQSPTCGKKQGASVRKFTTGTVSFGTVIQRSPASEGYPSQDGGSLFFASEQPGTRDAKSITKPAFFSDSWLGVNSDAIAILPKTLATTDREKPRTFVGQEAWPLQPFSRGRLRSLYR